MTTLNVHRLVKRYVDRLLRIYLGRGALAFRIVNVVALIGLYYSVHETARNAATAEAKEYVDLHLKDYIKDSAADVSKSIDAIHAKLLFEEQYSSMVTQRETLELALSILRGQVDLVKSKKGTA